MVLCVAVEMVEGMREGGWAYTKAPRPAWGPGSSVWKLLVCSGVPSILEEGGRAGSWAPSCVASVVTQVGGSLCLPQGEPRDTRPRSIRKSCPTPAGP